MSDPQSAAAADQSLDKADQLLEDAGRHLQEGRDYQQQVERDTYPDRQAARPGDDGLDGAEAAADAPEETTPAGVDEGDAPGAISEADASTPPADRG